MRKLLVVLKDIVRRWVIYPLQRLWEMAQAGWHTIAPVVFNVIVSALAILAFWFVPQGKDILVGFAEDGGFFRGLGFFSSLAYLCLANWYWPRFLLNCRFPGVHSRGKLGKGVENALRLYIRGCSEYCRR